MISSKLRLFKHLIFIILLDRSELAYGIRNGPYMVNCLIAGFDQSHPQLYWVDYMGTLVKSVKAAHG